jgi:hypothetical protein
MHRPAKLSPQRPLRNDAEAAFTAFAKRRGWVTSKRGWPDFFCASSPEADDQIMLVEVKPHRGRRLKSEQLCVMRALARYGVPCYRWSPDQGLTEVTPETQE